MPIKEEISEKFKAALKAKDETAKNALRGLKAAIQKEEISKGIEDLPDQDILALVQREVKRRVEAMELYGQSGRTDLMETEQSEKAILEAFLPRQMTEEEIRERVKAAAIRLDAVGPRDMGPLMKEVMAELKGQADGKLVNNIVRDILANS